MKCDELTPIDLECNFGKDINGVEHREPWKAYDIDEVKAAIEELKAENRRLKRALWLARAISAINAVGEIHNVIVCMRERHPKMSLSNTEAQEQVWKNVARKCRTKAKEYK